MSATHCVFNEVSMTVEKRGKCGCGKYRVRRQKFWQTLNPFNKTKDGYVKTRADIMPELLAQAEAWNKEPITCNECKP